VGGKELQGLMELTRLKAVGGGRGPLAVKSEIVALFRPRQSGVSKHGMGHKDTRASGIVAATVNDRSLR
jgi:hypothetical protein